MRKALLASFSLAALTLALVPASPAYAAATIVIVNNNNPGVGFNDPTPAAPVGGNPGTTIGQQRLMVIDKVSIINPLPASYANQIRAVEGVTDITHANWFGGYYQDMRNQFPVFATDPESWLRIYSKEFEVPEEQKKAFIANRTGAVVGIGTAKKYGWTVGQRIPIQGTIYQRPDGGPWEFTIEGIYDSKIKGADKTNLLFNYQYLRETIPERSGFRDRYNWYVFTIDNQVYDHSCVNTVVELGSIQEWTILNTAMERHVIPDRNVLALVEGSDPKLRDETVIVCAATSTTA